MLYTLFVTYEESNSKKGRPAGSSQLNVIGTLKKKRHNISMEIKKIIYNKNVWGVNKIQIADLDIQDSVPCWLYTSEVELIILKKYMEKNAFEYICRRFLKYKTH